MWSAAGDDVADDAELDRAGLGPAAAVLEPAPARDEDRDDRADRDDQIDDPRRADPVQEILDLGAADHDAGRPS